MKLSNEVLQELIELGRDGLERVPRSLTDETVAWRTLVCGNEPWIEAAKSIGPENVPFLIRGLVLYARASGRTTGGSVSAVIVLYRTVVERTPDLEPSLTSWVVAHRTNPYEPFGTINDEGAVTYADFVARRTVRHALASANEAREAEQQRQFAEIRAQRDRVESTQRLANAVRRGDLGAVQALFDKGADASRALPDGGSLVALADENGRHAVAEFLRARGTK